MILRKQSHLTDFDISVIIVSFNSKDDLRNCLNSLLSEQVSMEIWVVDNASSDGTQQMLQTEFRDIAIKVICNSKNIGFAPACNQPLSLCAGRYILFLNPDTIVKPGSIRLMVDLLDSDPSIGVVGPRLMYPDGSHQYSYGPDWSILQIILWHVIPLRLREYLQAFWLKKSRRWYTAREVDWVSGACLAIRRDLALKLGGFDSKIFLSLADCGDLCLRARKMGYRVMFYPKAEVIHLSGQSYKSAEARPDALFRAYQGFLYYSKKHHGQVSVILLRMLFALISFLKAIGGGLMSLFQRDPYRAKARAHLIVALKLIYYSDYLNVK